MNDQDRRHEDNLSPEERSRIGRLGGEASAEKAGHEGMTERGHKGGEAVRDEYGPEHFSEIGKKGGKHSHEGTQEQDENA